MVQSSNFEFNYFRSKEHVIQWHALFFSVPSMFDNLEVKVLYTT
jgi:hypothetical protein